MPTSKCVAISDIPAARQRATAERLQAASGIGANTVVPGPMQTDVLDRFTRRNAEAKAVRLSNLG
jgi:NAD(P)-dependent dehydrogenase (short-subunit alcohol dehydrogenase family)